MRYEYWSETETAACDGKKRMSYAAAVAVARRKNDMKRVAYKCRFCHGWHVGGVGDKAFRSSRGKK